MERGVEAVLLRAHTTTDNINIYSVPVPGVLDSPANGVEDGFLQITSAELTAIFAPTIDEITFLAARYVENDGLRVSVRYPAVLIDSCVLIYR